MTSTKTEMIMYNKIQKQQYKETNKSISNNNTNRVNIKTRPIKTWLVTGDSMLGRID